ncbi:MAG TPA: YfhO family protein [Chitinophagaceae bacterium]|nr:YfhO family protein [Chitinophagaceae bacterium]
MKFDFKKLVPHIIAIVIFLAASALMGRHALQGNVLSQHDVLGWKGMAQNAFEYKEKNGHFPLWNTALFSGMPNYQVAMDSKSVLPDINKVLTLSLPKPVSFFFLACICFYILSLVLRVNPYVGITGALAFAFSSYNPIIIGAGHETKMYAIAYMPALLAGLLLIYNKNYIGGLCLAAWSAVMEIGANHVQISYYLFLTIVAVTIVFSIDWIRKKEWKHMFVAFSLAAVSGGIGLIGSAIIMIPTYEYSKATMRGGKDVEIKDNKITNAKTSGLDMDYAFSYSNSIAEPLTILMPNAYGGGSGNPLPENSKVIEKLVDKGISESQAEQVAGSIPAYWGGIFPSTSGPVYYGALIVLLALLSVVFVKSPIKWGLLAAAMFGIVLSWGKYFMGVNTFIFNHLPLYNKFRAPSMAMVIVQLVVPILAILSLQSILFSKEKSDLIKQNLKKVLYITGGILVFCFIVYLFQSYSSDIDKQIISAYTDKNGNNEFGRTIVSALLQDRKGMFFSQLMRLAGFTFLLIGLLFLYSRKILSGVIVTVIVGLITVIDLFVVDGGYLNENNYKTPDEIAEVNFTANEANKQILEDKDVHYRVFNVGGDRFQESRTSYFHRSVGGYHPAKLRIYQDVIETYLSANPSQEVLDALDTKYILFTDQSGKQIAQLNPGAFGPCWLVKHISFVDSPATELTAIGNTHLRDTVIVNKEFGKTIQQPVYDSTASIKLVKYDNDDIEYSSSATTPQFAVLSEVYYPMGWNAYIDDKKTDYLRVDYFLRGIVVPAGNHKIQFKFEPSSYYTGRNLSFVVSIILVLLLVFTIVWEWKKSRTKTS